jgi:6,7-dimethyl-8-ribityllumazine synthase
MAEFIGQATGTGRRIAIAVSRFNPEITEKLFVGALGALVEHGVQHDDIDIVRVPGAWELPIAVRRLLASERYSAIIALGAVIRGDTPHFDYVCAETARGLADASTDFAIPVAMGVLTTDDDAQAEARAGGAHGNKGRDAALVALEMADLLDRLHQRRPIAPPSVDT